jgi:hypothetical protein
MRRQYGIKVPSFFNMPYVVQSSDLICGLPEHMALQVQGVGLMAQI